MLGWMDFRFFWKRRVLQLGAAAWPRSLIFISLRSRACSISRAWHFAILLSTAIACSFGRGPSSVSAKGFEAFSFSFRGKTTKIQFLRTFSRFGDGMGWLHGCTTIVLSHSTGLCLCSQAASPLPSGKAKVQYGNSCVCRGARIRRMVFD